MANKKQKTFAPVTNPELDAAIAELKKGNDPQRQEALIQALKKARLLSPCDFDVDIGQQKDGTIQNVHPSQIKFYLLNTNDGHTFFPVFTDIPKSGHMNFGKNIKPKEVVRTVKDFDKLLQDPNGKAQGLVINPGTDNVVIPANLVAVVAGRKPMPKTKAPANPAPLNVHYSEPAVYPTKMVNAIYDRCEQVKEISRVWLKQKTVGNVISFFIPVESDKEDEAILNQIREVAVPQAKDLEVEVVFVTDEMKNTILKDTVALYDRSLGF